jgi:hypothetical protein
LRSDCELFCVMAGHSRPYDDVAFARLCPGHDEADGKHHPIRQLAILTKTRFLLPP